MTNERITIDGQRYILDRNAGGEFILPAAALEHIAAQRADTNDIDAGFVPEFAAEKVNVQTPSLPGKCQLTGCDRQAKRKFCSRQHEHRYNALKSYRKKRGMASWVTLSGGAPAHYQRQFPSSLERAKRVFTEHIGEGVCQYRIVLHLQDGRTGDYCPSIANPYGDPDLPRCLLYATQADDLIIWQARVQGKPASRRYTTPDGRWLGEPYGQRRSSSPSSTSAEEAQPSRPLAERS